MAGLNDEIKALRERLSAVSVENDQLRGVRDELLAAQTEQRDDPPPAVDHDDVEDFRSRIADLQVCIIMLSVTYLQKSKILFTDFQKY